MLMTLDGQTVGYLKSPGIAHPSRNIIGFALGGKATHLKDVNVWEAKASADWPLIRTRLLQPLSKTAVAPVQLFNGADLTNFYTWLNAPAKEDKPYGKNNDPKKVFSVQDGMIRISGEVFGGLTTEKEYENYRLIVEYKWGKKTFPPREKNARDSGVLVHGVGDDGRRRHVRDRRRAARQRRRAREWQDASAGEESTARRTAGADAGRRDDRRQPHICGRGTVVRL